MIPRLFIEASLRTGETLALPDEHAHYLRNVLRRGEGDNVRLFNSRDGEFAAELVRVDKKAIVAALGDKLRDAESAPEVDVAFSPIKRAPTEYLIQKCVELGASAFRPVVTARTNSERLRIDRLKAIAREAAEQCGRMSVPEVSAPAKLAAFLADLPAGRALIFCDEAGDDPEAEWGGRKGRAAPLFEAVRDLPEGPATLLIGPEGGFSPQEREAIRSRTDVVPVTLGPRILRADTAAIIALGLWQAAKGDLARS